MKQLENLEVLVTPGNWVVDDNCQAGDCIHGYSIMAIGEETIQVAAVLRMDAGKLGLRSLADAVLMASAKKLFSALQELVELHSCEQEGLSSGMPTPEEWTAAVDRASEAIRSATTYPNT